MNVQEYILRFILVFLSMTVLKLPHTNLHLKLLQRQQKSFNAKGAVISDMEIRPILPW